ncbi:putative transcriptional regulator [Anaerobacterium chartisolvens]|uniref:Putative transcriptional regulator n=1 Tax=Anaerobacterium chartisolvens TaxID=1297424 RepID=A0A369AH29_9FIRM|nr:BlaI/MecI/CopY family transcriptional regulator [Anaerobacterium chartisolvens]RCX07586.1 putative transcriptional regulator [Anaerobacterium chartisolvens]
MRISSSEYEIMKIIWTINKTVTSSEVMNVLADKRNWKQPTVLTFLNRLCEKALLKTEKNGKLRSYTPTISESDYKKQETQAFLNELHEGSISNLITCMGSNDGLTAEDIDDLRKWLESTRSHD